MEALTGGLLIGLAATIMLLFNGRVVGISGIVSSLLKAETFDKSWRLLFLAGLFVGGLVLNFVHPSSFTLISQATLIDYVIAGFLVGVGTTLGGGCTSGHGVCGISRFSLRSVVSTITFIIFGILGVLLFKLIRGTL